MFKQEQKNLRYSIRRKRARPSDQYETPPWLKDFVYLQADKTENEVYDLVMYRPNWRNGYFFDALKEVWSHKLNWANVPFSHPLLFVM